MILRITMALLTVVMLGSCTVSSIHSLYNYDDLVTDAAIAGRWIDQDSTFYTIEKEGSAEFKVTVEDKEKRHIINFHVLRLENDLYIDFYPDEDYEEYFENELLYPHLFPVHSFAKLQISSNAMEVKPFNGQELKKLIKENRIRIAHEQVERGVVLTASTSELQKFVLKYSQYENAFSDILELRRVN